eukprot:3173062-Pyramimonas_sp.AAC.1
MLTKTKPPRTHPPTWCAVALPGHKTVSKPWTPERPICLGTRVASPPARPPVLFEAPGDRLAEYPDFRS